MIALFMCYFNYYIYLSSAVDAGIMILNEIGLDPGIDHMLAVECFDEVREEGGKVRRVT